MTQGGIAFGDLTSNLQVEPLQAAEQIETLFKPHDTISLSGKRVSQGPNRVITQFMKAKDFVESMRSEDGEKILRDLCFSPEPMDLYFGLGAVNMAKYRGPMHRVREQDILETRVLYADLDVKPGSFTSREHAYTWLSEVCNKNHVPPAYVADSGSGGLHVYWKLEKEFGQPIDAVAGKGFSVMWWSWLQEQAGDIHIDKLVDMARMSRVSGTIHWPKESGDGVGLVRGLFALPNNVVKSTYVLSLCKDSFERLKKRRETIKEIESRPLVLPKNISPDIDLQLNEGSLASLYMQASIEPYVNAHVSWSDILTRAGWTYLRTDGEGREEWARPGRTTKSAVVNWPESPNIMSLMSTSHETGLSDLLDAEIPLTKWRVLVRLLFKDNFEEASVWVIKNMLANGQ
jgi:hypothetical protein